MAAALRTQLGSGPRWGLIPVGLSVGRASDIKVTLTEAGGPELSRLER